jgi:methanogenic corrinoid protein MtbC1
MPATCRYPIAVAARLTGLTLDTIRAWERRYGAVEPERGVRGRLYSDAQVQRLRLLAALVERGHAISAVAALPTPRLETLLDRTSPSPAGSRPPGRPVTALAVDAIEGFDHLALARELARLASLYAPRDLVYDVVLPLMRVVGERWHQGTLSVAQEHLVSAVVHSILGTIVRLHEAPPDAPGLLFAGPEGEWHEFGLLAAAMLASAAGLGVLYLGPNLPTLEIAGAAAKSGVAAAVVAMTGGAAATARQLPALRQALPPRVELWVGGPGPEAWSPPATARNRVVPIGSLEDFERHARRVRGASKTGGDGR